MKKTIIPLMLLLSFNFSCKKDKKISYPTQGLISYFNFDDNLKDQQGYAGDGIGSNSFISGKIGKAADFNGIDNGLVFTPKIAAVNSSISIACWVKTNLTSGDVILYTTDSNLSAIPGSMYFSVTLQGGGVAAAGSFSTGEWNHVVGTYDGNQCKIYINGILLKTSIKSGSTNGFNFQLGLGKFGNQFWAGSLDELFIYNRSLTDAEVKTLYNLGL